MANDANELSHVPTRRPQRLTPISATRTSSSKRLPTLAANTTSGTATAGSSSGGGTSVRSEDRSAGLVYRNRAYHIAKATEARQRREALQAAAQHRAAVLREACDAAFCEGDVDGSGLLEPAEARRVVTRLCAQGAAADHDGTVEEPTLSDAAYRFVVGCALEEYPAPIDAHISREQMPQLLAAAQAFTRRREQVVALLAKHDADCSGELSLRELLDALIDVSPAGVSVRAGDILWLVSRCDLDGDAKLSAEELAPAIGLWLELAVACGDQAEDQTTTASILEEVAASMASGAAPPPETARSAGGGEGAGDYELEGADAAAPRGGSAPSGGSSSRSSGIGAELLEATNHAAGKYLLPPIANAAELPNPREARLRERVHRLEGAITVRSGVRKSYVRTVTRSLIVVTNTELKKAVKLRERSTSKTSKRLAHLRRTGSARRVTPSFHADSDAYPGTLTAEASRMQVTEVTKHVKGVACCATATRSISRRPVTWLLLVAMASAILSGLTSVLIYRELSSSTSSWSDSEAHHRNSSPPFPQGDI